MKIIAHIDLNAFFAQVEMNRNPVLKGKPVAVGGGIRGVVATSNYEARKFGVTSGMAASEAQKICPDLIFLHGDYAEYRRQSSSFFSEVKNTFPIIEMASIDECYADATAYLEGLDSLDMHDKVFDFQMALLRKTGLKCSIGIGHTRFMAKMGSDYKKPLGLTFFLESKDWQKKLWPLRIGKMFGIGKMTAPKLEEIGILTIGDLVNKRSPQAQKIIGSYYDYLVEEACGMGSDSIITSRGPHKSCSNDITLPTDATDYEELRQYLVYCAKEVGKEMRKHGLMAKTVCLKIRDNSFVTLTKRESMAEYTDDDDALANQALRIFDHFYKNQPLRLIGCSVEGCLPKNEIPQKRTDNQMTLFDEHNGFDDNEK